MPRILGQQVAFLVANEGVEEVELSRPWEAVVRAGGEPTLIALRVGTVQTMQHLNKAVLWGVDRAVADVDACQFDALVLPGGVVNVDVLRTDPVALRFVKAMFSTGRPCAAISHAAWLLVEADLVNGRTLTSRPSMKTDIRNAGGDWLDAETIVCHRGPNLLLTSRAPADLPAFCSSLLAMLEADVQERWAPLGLPARRQQLEPIVASTPQVVSAAS